MNVESCQLEPSSIALGESTSLIVTLDSPAPPEGQEIAISSDMNGAADTFVSIPEGIPVHAGDIAAEFVLRTQATDNPATSATFYASVIGGEAKSGKLDINIS